MKILYHANCNDGSGAALAVWMLHGDNGNDYIPVQYGSPPPDGLEGEQVIMVDFSYKADVIIELSKVVESILIIDHHKTAEKELTGIMVEKTACPTICLFDMERSGAVMAWNYFHDTADVPQLLRHVQDRDLWKLELPSTKAVTAALQLYPDFREWERFIYKENSVDNELIPAGEAIIKYLDMQAEKIVKTEPRVWGITGDMVPIYNLPDFMISDTLHKALTVYPQCPYAVAYFDLPDKRVYSLRSRSGGDVDVSEIASKHGGGGHKHAAGFSVEIDP